MLKKRDAQGLSIQVVILAVIALIVLVVIVAIFTRETGRTSSALESCEGRGGECMATIDLCGQGRIMPGVECPKEKRFCCYTVDKLK
ncbi:MAG: hypothetical protein V1831_00635 [Candidatus Woesearchaeota archaeon]